MKLKVTEHQIQASFVEWCDLNPLRLPNLDLIYAQPNGGKRDKGTAIKLKKEGVKSGVPDMFLPVPIYPLHGLYLEFKSLKGKLRKQQYTYLKRLHDQGYRVRMPRSLEEAIQNVTNYYGLRK